jgi:RNA polymerase sigma-70 factor (ECF subfamily)
MEPLTVSDAILPTPGPVIPRTPAGSEESLVRRLRRGEEAAFETIVRDYGGRLLAVARRFLRNEEDARDAVQEAFLSAFKSLASFEENSSLSTWLHRIVMNASLMKLRTRRRKAEDSIEDLLPRFVANGHQASPSAEWGGSAEAHLERSETRALVRRSIDRLPQTHRAVLLLRDIEELSTEECARLLGITENAVKIRLHRARQALRGLLDPHLRRAAPPDGTSA